MKIGIVGPLPPLRGGISHYNASLVENLRENGHIVYPISFHRLYPPFLFPGSSEQDPDAEPTPRSKAMLIPWHRHTWKDARLLFQRVAIDRLVMHLWHPFFVPTLWDISRVKSVRGLVIIAHNVLPHEHQWLGKMLNRQLFKRADLVVVGGSSEQEVLSEISPYTRSVFVPHPLYDRYTTYIKGISKQAARKKLDLSPDVPILMHLGLVRKYKGVDLLIDAFGKLNNEKAQLLVAGEFYDDFDKYRHQVKKSRVRERITLNNKYLSDEDLALHIRAADAVVLPYRDATQSGMAMAVLACGTPVVATSVGALPDVIEPGVLGELSAPGDSGELTAAIERVMNDERYQSPHLTSSIMQIVKSRFSWNRLTDQITGEL